jgi:hypothetical protein
VKTRPELLFEAEELVRRGRVAEALLIIIAILQEALAES